MRNLLQLIILPTHLRVNSKILTNWWSCFRENWRHFLCSSWLVRRQFKLTLLSSQADPMLYCTQWSL